MLKDLTKTGTFAILHFSVGFGIAYLVSGSLPVALGVALIEPAVNTIVFFLHERVWQRLGSAPEAQTSKSRIEDRHSFSVLRALAHAG